MSVFWQIRLWEIRASAARESASLVTNEGEAEWKDGSVKRKGLSIGDQILEMQAKKLKAE